MKVTALDAAGKLTECGSYSALCTLLSLGGQLKSHTWGHFKTAHYPVGTSKSHA